MKCDALCENNDAIIKITKEIFCTVFFIYNKQTNKQLESVMKDK